MNIKQSRIAAFDENTEPTILANLAISSDKLTRQYVAKNPNTTIETLSMLGEEFPEEVIK